jgi:hypothetical protein
MGIQRSHSFAALIRRVNLRAIADDSGQQLVSRNPLIMIYFARLGQCGRPFFSKLLEVEP